VNEHRAYKFGVQVDHSKSQPVDDKLSLKWAWSRHVTHFKKNFSLSKISLERLKLQTSNFVYRLATWSISLRIAGDLGNPNHPKPSQFLHFSLTFVSSS